MDILHVDMDAFFASVEVKDNPELKGKPVVVGGLSSRGVVAACTYEARAYGVKSGMSILMAKKLSPQAVFLSGRYNRYAQISKQLAEILQSYSPYVEFVSLDEAFLDVTHGHKIFGSNIQIANSIIASVKAGLDLDCCVGIGTSKLVAKIASKKAKPKVTIPNQNVLRGSRIFEVPPGDELVFMSNLELKEIWGIGPKTVAKLNSYGILKVGDVNKVSKEFLESILKPSGAKWLLDVLNARDERSVEVESVPKSISIETTYETDITRCEQILNEIPKLADNLTVRLKANNLTARTIVVKIKDKDFKITTRSNTMAKPTDDIFKILEGAKRVVMGQYFNSMSVDGILNTPIRLFGLGLTNLNEPEILSQQNLFEQTALSKITEVLYNVKDRFGLDSIGPASLIKEGKLVTKKRGEAQWG